MQQGPQPPSGLTIPHITRRPKRPIGLTILGVCDIILGLVVTWGAIVIIPLVYFIQGLHSANVASGYDRGPDQTGILVLADVLLGVLGLMLIITGICLLVMGRLAWILAVATQILIIVDIALGLILAILSLQIADFMANLPGLVLTILVLRYLFLPHVRPAFMRRYRTAP